METKYICEKCKTDYSALIAGDASQIAKYLISKPDATDASPRLCHNCFDKDYFTCAGCGNAFVRNNYEPRLANSHNWSNSHNWCETCFSENWIYRTCCDELTSSDDARYTRNDDALCEECYDAHYFTCESCGSIYHNDEFNDGYCHNCFEGDDDNSENNNTFRKYHTGNNYTTAGKRFYSCEIEAYYPDYDAMDRVASEIDAGIGITDDGSLSNKGKELWPTRY